MVHYFLGATFDLAELAPVGRELQDRGFAAKLETVEATIKTPDLQTACLIGEFILNSIPMPNPILWSDLEQYIESQFKRSKSIYEFSCNQDFLLFVRV